VTMTSIASIGIRFFLPGIVDMFIRTKREQESRLIGVGSCQFHGGSQCP
jgi:hypothetical protein